MSAGSAIKAKCTKANIRRSCVKTCGSKFSNVCALGAERAKRTRQASEAPLAGKLFDDRGNRMSPSWAKKGSKRWRYYVSQAALQGDKSKAGSVVRVAAATIEHWVVDVISKQSAERSVSQADLRDLIDRVTIGRAAIQVQLSEAAETDVGARTLTVP